MTLQFSKLQYTLYFGQSHPTILSVQTWGLKFLFCFCVDSLASNHYCPIHMTQTVLAWHSFCSVMWVTGPTEAAPQSSDLQNGTYCAFMVFVHVKSVEIKDWAVDTVLGSQSSEKEYRLNWLQKAAGRKVTCPHSPSFLRWQVTSF